LSGLIQYPPIVFIEFYLVFKIHPGDVKYLYRINSIIRHLHIFKDLPNNFLIGGFPIAEEFAFRKTTVSKIIFYARRELRQFLSSLFHIFFQFTGIV
jgi:hypothetical protein